MRDVCRPKNICFRICICPLDYLGVIFSYHNMTYVSSSSYFSCFLSIYLACMHVILGVHKNVHLHINNHHMSQTNLFSMQVLKLYMVFTYTIYYYFIFLYYSIQFSYAILTFICAACINHAVVYGKCIISMCSDSHKNMSTCTIGQSYLLSLAKIMPSHMIKLFRKERWPSVVGISILTKSIFTLKIFYHI